MRLWEGVNAKTGARFSCGVGVERFLGPEALFRPDMVTSQPAQPLPEARRAQRLGKSRPKALCHCLKAVCDGAVGHCQLQTGIIQLT